MTHPLHRLCLLGIGILSFFDAWCQRREIDSLARLLDTTQLGIPAVDVMNELAIQYTNVNADTAIYYAGEALEMAEQLDYKKGIAAAYARMGSAYFSKAQDDLSLESYLKSLKLSEEINDSTNLCFVHQGLGIIYDIMGQEEDAMVSLRKALRIADLLSLNQRKANIYRSMSVVGNQIYSKDSAMSFIKESLRISEDLNYNQGIVSALNFMATIHIHLKNYDEALEQLQRSLRISMQERNLRRANYALIRIGRIYTIRKEYQKAKEVLLEAVKVVEGTNLNSYEQDAYEELYVLDTLMGDYKSAFIHYEKNTELKEAIFNTQTANRLRELTDKYEAEKRKQELEIQEQKIVLLEKDQQIKAMWRNILIVGIILIAVAAIVLFKYQKNQNIRKQKYLNQKIEFQSKELASYTINFIQKRNLFESVEENLKEVELEIEKESVPKIRKIRRLIKQEDNIDRDWEEFKLHFESVHKNFFPILQRKHPDVRGGDLKLCALINLNMNIKEMSAILGISINSVKTARYRLRKKLNLDHGDSLHSYISSLEKSISSKES